MSGPARLAPRTLAAVGAVHLASALAGWAVSLHSGNLLAVRPAAAVALAAVLRLGPGTWPAILVASVLGNLLFLRSVPGAAVVGLGNTLAALLGGAALRRVPGFRDDLPRPRDLLAVIVVGGLLAGLVSAGVGAFAATAFSGAGGPSVGLRHWWASNAFAIALFAPLLLTLGRAPRPLPLTRERLAEAAVAMALLAAGVLAGLTAPPPGPVLHLVPLVWLALRFGHRAGTLAALLPAAVAASVTLDGAGPLAQAPDPAAAFELWLGVLVLLGPVVGAMTDLRHRVERALAAERERLRVIIASSPLPMVVTTLDEVVQEWNPAAERVLGWTAAEAVGRPLPCLDDAERRQEAALAARLAAGEPLPPREVELRTKGGERVEACAFVALLRADDGRPPATLRILEPVGERKRLEREAREGAKLEAVGRLAAGVAHDFNNLMTTVIGLSDFVLTHLPPDDPYHEDLDEIRRAGRRAAVLTQQLLAMGAAERLDPRPLDLNDVILDATPMLREVLGEGVRLGLELEPQLAAVRGDRARLAQVLRILAENAREAMPAGGRFTVATTQGDLGEPRDGAGGAAWVQLDVSDSGEGMTPEVRARLFEPFFSTRAPGRGLGLATAYGILKQLGGVVAVSSEPGRGTSVRILLPRATAPAPAPSGPRERR
ncbi:MAG: MASE1 domain-containing protein [Gemmatimonadales bacterium]|nr:MASE1 domain-containing protein [Gemmatimonadales bacterium]